MVDVLAIDTPSLGDRSYLAHDGNVAVVIDPQRDVDRVGDLAAQLGVRITHVAETHIHNDYLTGGLALAEAAGASYLVSGADPVRFSRTAVQDGDHVPVSDAMTLRVLATPGHTFSHLAYVLESADTVLGVFTGGSLLYGSTGRPDLLGPDSTPALARAQYRSAHRLASELPDTAAIYPTHGFGSFCAATQAGGLSSTIGHEKQVNPALTREEHSYLAALLAGLDVWPAYYAHMAPANAAGPAAPDLSAPHRADPAELRRRIEAGEWVVDLRDRVAFAAGFLPGSVAFPLDGSFATYLGWALPWGTPVTLLGATPDQVSAAQRELVRIGIDRPAAAATGHPAGWSGGRPLRSYPVADFTDLETVRRHRQVVILDVRRDAEWDASHITGAVHIPLHQLPARLAEVPPGEVWVHCEAGYRASVAASFLDAAGRTVVAVDDDYDRAARAGLLAGGLLAPMAAN